MLWSGSSPLSVVRDGMWGFLLFAGVAWLAIAWSVLRLEPTDIVNVAGPVILFGALTEAVRALAGTRTWWLNAGMAALFAASGVIMLAQGGSSWTTPAALIGWFLMVRGAADVAISMVTRESDRIWGLLMVVGVAELGLGFFAASSFARTAELVIVVLGGAALARAVADLVASLRLREASVVSRAERLLELPAERAIGVAGYAAGMTDFVGLGRIALSYPDLPADVLAGVPLKRKFICRTFSDCTTGPRMGLVSGCYPLDPHYVARPEAARILAVRTARSVEAKES